jgi:hypothetical protein
LNTIIETGSKDSYALNLTGPILLKQDQKQNQKQDQKQDQYKRSLKTFDEVEKQNSDSDKAQIIERPVLL